MHFCSHEVFWHSNERDKKSVKMAKIISGSDKHNEERKAKWWRVMKHFRVAGKTSLSS